MKNKVQPPWLIARVTSKNTYGLSINGANNQTSPTNVSKDICRRAALESKTIARANLEVYLENLK